MSLEDVASVAAQVGVDPDLVRQAFEDVRIHGMTGDAPDWLDRVLGPRTVVDTAVVPNRRTQVTAGLDRWMTSDEGLRRQGTRDGADRWTKDGRLLVTVRHSMSATRADGVLRGLRGVTSRVEDVTDGTVVVLEADTTSIRATNAAVLSVGVFGGVVAGVASALGLEISSDVLEFVLGFGLPVAASAGTTVAIHKVWLSKVRTSVATALDGITMTTNGPDHGAGDAGREGWRMMARRMLGRD